nr:15543_t:CDS:2 [Entrophospora candida]
MLQKILKTPSPLPPSPTTNILQNSPPQTHQTHQTHQLQISHHQQHYNHQQHHSIPQIQLQKPPANEELDRIFTEKLKILKMMTLEYAKMPIEKVFNWNEIANELRQFEINWYVVVFRSVRKADADNKLLFEADANAQDEARKSGGLLAYWYGELNERRECLAMCIWSDQYYAKMANNKPNHVIAMKLTAMMYETYKLDRYFIKKNRDQPEFTVEKYQ